MEHDVEDAEQEIRDLYKPSNSLWWSDAFVITWMCAAQAAWIGVQLRYTAHQSWAGVFLPMYVLAVYWLARLVMWCAMRMRYHRHADHEVHDVAVGANHFYSNTVARHSHTADSYLVSNQQTHCQRLWARAFSARSLVLFLLLVVLAVPLIMAIVKLEDHDVYGWDVVWFTASALMGALALLVTAAAFFYPLRAFYYHASDWVSGREPARPHFQMVARHKTVNVNVHNPSDFA